MIETISRTGYAFLRYLATRLLRIDLMLLALVVTLTTIGFIALFSAGYSFPWRIEGQIRNIAVAGVVMLVVSCIPVKAFQKAKGLKQDGIVGKNTAEKLGFIWKD